MADAVLDRLSDVPRVILLTSMVDAPWVESDNELIRSAVQRQPNAVVFDWADFGPTCLPNPST